MRSSLSLWVAVLLLLGSTPAAAERGRLEVGVSAGWIDFDDEIRFEDDLGVSFHATAEVLDAWSLGLELTRVGARDDDRGIWQDVVLVSIRSRLEPFRGHRITAGGIAGVSFMAFENQPHIDAVSEGFELGPSFGVVLGEGWRARAELLSRVQTVTRVRLDETGQIVGDVEETGYLWSKDWRVGVSYGF